MFDTGLIFSLCTIEVSHKENANPLIQNAISLQ